MSVVTVLPHPRIQALGTGREKRDGGMKLLLEEQSPFLPMSLEEALARQWTSDAHFCQYSVWLDDQPFARTWRLKHGSLSTLENETPFHARASVLAIDIDLAKNEDGSKAAWPEGGYETWVEAIRERQDEASYATVYKTAHGARLVWPLSEPFVLVQRTAKVWRDAYAQFALKLGPIGPNGEVPDRVCADWTRLFRLPNVVREGVAQDGELSVGSGQPLELELNPGDASLKPMTRAFVRAVEPDLEALGGMAKPKKRKKKTSVPRPPPDEEGPPLGEPSSLAVAALSGGPDGAPSVQVDEAAEELAYQLWDAAEVRGRELLDDMETDPVFVWARANPTKVPYALWRALGTNYFACGENVPSRGSDRWHALSALDPERYDFDASERAWEGIVDSGRDYGPVTYGSMRQQVGDELWTQIYGFNKDSWPAERSSPAGQVYRSRRDPVLDLAREGSGSGEGEGSSAKIPPGTETADEVRPRLTTKPGKEGDPPTIVRSSDNLLLIMAYDKQFATLRRNLLGIIDEYRGKPISDEDMTALRHYVEASYGLVYTYDNFCRFIRWMCSLRAYQPVADYLKGLRWDGVDRLDELLECLHLRGDAYARRVLRRWLVSVVVRPLNHSVTSGTKVDTVLVLKGAQGMLKSSFFKALMPSRDWFSDSLPSIETCAKDAALHTLGAWLIECAEFDGHVSRASIETLKSFVTRSVERFRPPYARCEVIVARPSVLVGTTNSETFLHDPTGDRRFWVLEAKQPIDIVRVRTLRDDLWAQAVADYTNGHQWWLTTREDAERQLYNQPYRQLDPVENCINQWMAACKRPPNDFPVDEVLQKALGKEKGEATRALLTNIGAALAKLGYKAHQLRGPNGTRIRHYRHPDLPLVNLLPGPDCGPAGG